MSDPPTLIFDLDDTLILERDFVESGFNALDAFMAERGVMGFGADCWAQFQAGRRGDIFDRVLQERGLLYGPEEIRLLVDCYRTHTPKISLAPDAARLLAKLEEADHAYGIITDGPLPMQKSKLAALSLERRAAIVICTDQWGREFWKPHERAFRVCADALGNGPFVYIADNPAKDFVAPRQLGWASVRLRRPGGEHFHAEPSGAAASPDLEVETLDQLFAALQIRERLE